MLEYITTRDLQNKTGQTKGKVRIVKNKEDNFALVEFTCPECSYTEKTKKEWTSPFVEGSGINQKFNLSCSKCSFSIKIMKLKKEIKKKR
jgi:ssDNA-binding Zn-finger/Zn-ribbon topoisomerase 1